MPLLLLETCSYSAALYNLYNTEMWLLCRICYVVFLVIIKNISDFPSFKQDFISGGSRNERCDIVSNLINKGCSVNLIEYPSVHVIPSENEKNTQVTPGEVLIQLREGMVIFK